VYPKLFEIGPVSIFSYGLMLGIAFLIGNYLLSKELKRNKRSEETGIALTFLSLIGGILGAKVFYVIEEWNFGKGMPILTYLKPDILFTGLGLTFYGGLIFAIIFVIIYCRIKKLPILEIFDYLSPAVMLGYGIARIGCHLSGDGDYGIAVNGTFWEFLGYSYLHGTVPTQPGELVHPTSIYEFIVSFVMFFILVRISKVKKYNGQIFFLYLIFAGLSRLLVEFIRLNPRIILNLSQAQVISIIMILSGIAGILIMNNRMKREINSA